MKLFRWAQRKRWEGVVQKLMCDVLDHSVFAAAQERCGDSWQLVENKFAWVRQLVFEIHHQKIDLVEYLAPRLAEVYDGVVAFHGCRPYSLESYKVNGLMPSDRNTLHACAIELFGSTPEVQRVIASMPESYVYHNHGRIYFSLAKGALVGSEPGSYNHYLENGSEFLSGVARRLGRLDDLHSVGTPMIIECVITKEQLPEDWWFRLSQCLLEFWLRSVFWPGERDRLNDMCFCIESSVAPARMVFREMREVRKCFIWMQDGVKHMGHAIHFRPATRSHPTRQTPPS